MSYDKVQVGNRIRGSRLEKGWTQERLAAEAEISVQQLRALEKGQRNLGVDHLGRLSDAMGVSSDFLLKGCFENSILVCKPFLCAENTNRPRLLFRVPACFQLENTQ